MSNNLILKGVILLKKASILFSLLHAANAIDNFLNLILKKKIQSLLINLGIKIAAI